MIYHASAFGYWAVALGTAHIFVGQSLDECK